MPALSLMLLMVTSASAQAETNSLDARVAVGSSTYLGALGDNGTARWQVRPDGLAVTLAVGLPSQTNRRLELAATGSWYPRAARQYRVWIDGATFQNIYELSAGPALRVDEQLAGGRFYLRLGARALAETVTSGPDGWGDAGYSKTHLHMVGDGGLGGLVAVSDLFEVGMQAELLLGPRITTFVLAISVGLR